MTIQSGGGGTFGRRYPALPVPSTVTAPRVAPATRSIQSREKIAVPAFTQIEVTLSATYLKILREVGILFHYEWGKFSKIPEANDLILPQFMKHPQYNVRRVTEIVAASIRARYGYSSTEQEIAFGICWQIADVIAEVRGNATSSR